MASALVGWLSVRSPDELATVISRRRDVLVGAPLVDLDNLALRLEKEGSVLAALSTVTLPQAQVVETLAGFGGPAVPLDRLAQALGRQPGDADLVAALAALGELALVWPDDAGDLRMAGPLWSHFEFPLGLGPRAAAVLETVDRARLGEIAAVWRLRPDRSRPLAGAIADVLTDERRVRAAVEAAPKDARALVEELARGGPTVELPARPEPATTWALDRGLIVADGWRQATMPGDVAMALRGSGWHAPFDPRPPALDVTLAPAAAVSREAAAAGTLAVLRMGALLDTAGRTPFTLLKSGGVGNRELRRAAKATGDTLAEDVRLWFEVGYAAGLLGLVDETVAPTAAYDDWAATTPAERLATIVTTWLGLATVPTSVSRPGGGPALAALMPDLGWGPVLDARPGVLRLLGSLPAGRGAAAATTADDGLLADGDTVAAALHWRLPTLVPTPESPDPLVECSLHEAALLGLVAHGALTPLGRALVEAPDTLGEVAAGLLPDAVAEAIFQADLTALVPGLPTAPLATLLDTAAERESTDGAATTWRFTAATVRAALDAGFTSATLLEGLRIVAAQGVLPQALEYLVGDVGRQHGLIRVRAVGCVLQTATPGLAAELVAARSLRGLGLVSLAPGILSSPRPVEETLDALRVAGYSPAGYDLAGALIITRTPRVRGVPRRRHGHIPTARPAPSQTDLVELAARLLDVGPALSPARPRLVAAPTSTEAASSPTQEAQPTGGERPMLWLVPELVGDDEAEAEGDDPTAEIAATVKRHTPKLSPRERDMLVYAIVVGGQVTIDYRSANGDFSTRMIEPLELDGKRLIAWCHLREDERVFGLTRIERVTPG